MTKLRVAVHKFTSCDGCQLALLNLGPTLLAVAERFELLHFAEAGPIDPDAPVDVALIEGSISTPGEEERIRRIRAGARHLVAIGACANSGGIQALRNLPHEGDWVGAIYASPQHVETLSKVRAISDLVKVDLELWGCPVSGEQVLATLRALSAGVLPVDEADKVWVSEWSAQAMLRFDPATEKFESFKSSTETANVRQIHGRKGEVWTPESASGKLVVYRYR